MLRIRCLVAALVVDAVALCASAQELCSCTAETFSWGGCAADGSCDPGQWNGCTPSPDDNYVIHSGCHVLLDGKDLLLDQTSPRNVTVQSGGSLTMRGPAELRLGPVGLSTEVGSRIDLGGCFRRVPASGADCEPTLVMDALFPIGRVLPCRDGDCSDGDAETVRLDWTGLDVGINALLDRIDVSRDAICFWQASTSGAIGSDSGYCYRVTGVGRDADQRWLEFDIRQVWSTQSDQAGYPLARRLVQEATLASDVPAGTRTLSFLSTSLVEGRAGPAGRFVRCEGEQLGYLIASAKDDPGGDVLTLADSRGTRSDYPAGTTCHVDWGWAEGDAAFIMAPLHVTARTPQSDHTKLTLRGETSLRGVVIDGLGGAIGVPYGAAVEVSGGPLVALEHVWVVDPLVTNTASVLLRDLPCDSAVRHLVVTGGPANADDDKNYGLAWFGGSTCAYSVEHLYTRFMGDDNFVLESSGAAPVGAIDLRWVQAGPSSQPGDSGQFFDFGRPNRTSVTVRDAFCTACTSDDGRGSLVGPSAGPGLVENLLWVGVRNGGLMGVASNNWSFAFRHFGVVGSNVDATNSDGAGPLAGLVADGFYVRDVVDPRVNPNRLCVSSTTGAQTRSLSHGIFSNVSFGDVPCQVGEASLSDLYFLDVSRTVPGPLLMVEPWANDVRLSRLTMAFTRRSSGLTYGVVSPYDAAAPELTIDGLLLTGLRGAYAKQAMNLESAADAAQMAWGAPTCFYDNVKDESAVVLAGYGVAPVQGVDPHFVNPAAGRFDLAPDGPLAGVGCGAGKAGYPENDWAHRKAKLSPMWMANPPRACGLGAEIASLLALLALRARRLTRGSRAASRRGSGCPSGELDA